MRRTIWAAGLGALALAGIVTVTACSTPEPAGVGCAKLSHWSAADQAALGAAYDGHAEGSIERRAIDDLKYMRDQARACRK